MGHGGKSPERQVMRTYQNLMKAVTPSYTETSSHKKGKEVVRNRHHIYIDGGALIWSEEIVQLTDGKVEKSRLESSLVPHLQGERTIYNHVHGDNTKANWGIR